MGSERIDWRRGEICAIKASQSDWYFREDENGCWLEISVGSHSGIAYVVVQMEEGDPCQLGNRLVDAMVRCVREARQDPASAVGVPEGWVLVPRIINIPMIEAFEEQHQHNGPNPDLAWAAMLAASPAPPAASDQSSEYRRGWLAGVEELRAANVRPDGAVQCSSCGGWNLSGMPLCCETAENSAAAELPSVTDSTPNYQNALALAQRFHEVYEHMAPNFGYETRADTRQFDRFSMNGRLMIAVCAEISTGAATAPQGEAVICVWHQQEDGYDCYSTSCGHEFRLDDGAQGPMTYCTFCALPFRLAPWASQDLAASARSQQAGGE